MPCENVRLRWLLKFYQIIRLARKIKKNFRKLILTIDIGKREEYPFGMKNTNNVIYLNNSTPPHIVTLVSLAGGFFHVPIGNYIVATLVGSYIRNGILIAIGYLGIENIEAWQQGIHSIESSLGFIFLLAALVGFYLWRYLKSRRAAK